MLRSLSVCTAAFGALVLAPCAGGQEFSFRDVSREAGLNYPPAAPRFGASVGDYDGDGLLDVCFAGGADPTIHIYRNNTHDRIAALSGPNATPRSKELFIDVTRTVFPSGALPASFAMFADLDNDGDQDLALTRRYSDRDGIGFFYYENVGGIFIPGNVAADLAYEPTGLGSLVLGDVDDDGDLDVTFMHTGYPSPGRGFLLRNDLPAGFVDVTSSLAPTFSTPRRFWGSVMADFTGDQLVDLHSAIDFSLDLHCRNVPGIGLQDISTSVGTTGGGSDMGICVGDPDNDGDLDIYATNIGFGVLHVNDGTGYFSSEADPRGVRDWPNLGVGWGTSFSDLDLDLDEDLLFVNNIEGSIFTNQGTGYFHDGTAGSGVLLLGFGLISFDYDNDGDLDLLITDKQADPVLYENTTLQAKSRNWLIVDLFGAFSNRDGVGALVSVEVNGQTRHRAILAGQSFFNGPPINAHFGLGSQPDTCKVVVQWPSGVTRTLKAVPANQHVTAYELSCDLDADCDVDFVDLLTLIWNLGLTGAAHSDGDVDGDQDVDNRDLVALTLQLSQECTNLR